jgi:dimethylhistidine N-methyltransferase
MNNKFAEDVKAGLSAEKKYLSSMYFYDDAGSRIFQKIMAMPEYYLTNCEFDILRNQPDQILGALAFDRPFNIIELGAGDGSKTIELLKYITSQQADVTYIPVDISSEVTQRLADQLACALPSLTVQPMVGDYFKVLQAVEKDDKPHLLLFLGSNIGNYESAKALNLMKLFSASMHPADKLLIGFDLKKNPATIAKAYFDPAGITKSFNLNLLTRINRELKADFNIAAFDFYSCYNPINGEIRSYLLSTEEQIVNIDCLKQYFKFGKNELIYTELSKKYDLVEIEQLGTRVGLKIERHFLDSKNYFSDSLFSK